MMDGISLNGKMHLFGIRMELGDGGLFNFAVAGVALLSVPLDSPNPGLDVVQVDAPLHYTPSDGRGEIIFGAGVMVNTAEAGASVPDGYIYAYGCQNDPFIKKLVVARVLPGQFEYFNQRRFWDGSTWSADIGDSAGLVERTSVDTLREQFYIPP